jgi:hypothetical protein
MLFFLSAILHIMGEALRAAWFVLTLPVRLVIYLVRRGGRKA